MHDDLSAEEMRAWAPRPESGAPAVELWLPGYSGFHLVAQGGEGAVYRARQDGLGRDVAIKVLQLGDPATLARFRRELEITVRLGRQHPHIVTVLDTGTLPDGRPGIVMEFYDLGSLHDRLRAHGPLPVAEVVAAGTAVADALAFAHGQGILHRDVKPQNVLVLPTSYVLADFGIARGADAGHSASLQMVSYRHAAPQMLDGGAPASADDVWSLGSTLFTLLTGAPPFAGDNPDEDTVLPYLDRVRSAEPRPLTRPDVPPALADLIARCLRKRREDRFPDAATLRDALAAVGADLRRWQPTVDPDATAIAPGTANTPVEGPTELPDFGPRPADPPPPDPTPEPAVRRPAAESRGTMTGRLADLTVRHAEPHPAEFGPGVDDPDPPQASPRQAVTEPDSQATTIDTPPTQQPDKADHPTPSAKPDTLGPAARLPGKPDEAIEPKQGHVLDKAEHALPSGRADPDTGFAPSRGVVDSPTVPRLSPARDGFPAMPSAHEWEFDTGPTGTADPRTRTGWRGFAVAGVVAAVVGVGIGVLANRDGTSVGAPTTAVTTPTTSPAPIPPGGDPAVAPVLTKVDDRGASVELFWEDPTRGRAEFVLFDVTNVGTQQALTGIAAGLTSFVVTGLDAGAPEYCFQLVAIGLDDPATQRGASDRMCTQR